MTLRVARERARLVAITRERVERAGQFAVPGRVFVRTLAGMGEAQRSIRGLLGVEEVNPMLLWNEKKVVLIVACRQMTPRTELDTF